MAIGDTYTKLGTIDNVVTIFNGECVKIKTSSIGNPAYEFLKCECTLEQEANMLRAAKSVCGIPFSNIGMIRSMVYPRKTSDVNPKTFYCAELISWILKQGNVLPATINPGASTPGSLWDTFKTCSTITTHPTKHNLTQHGHPINSNFNHVPPNRPKNEIAMSLSESLKRSGVLGKFKNLPNSQYSRVNQC
jgi:hypothetical protein